MSAKFDFAPIFPRDLPPPAVKWGGTPKYHFIGGNNDPDQVPVEALREAADLVLKREGALLSHYNVSHGPQGYKPLREFVAEKLKRDAEIVCTADDLVLVSGSLQALDLINAAFCTRGDTVIFEQESYQGSITRMTRLGVKVVGTPLDQGGMRMDVLENQLADLKSRGVKPKYIYVIPTVQNPTATIMSVERREQILKISESYGVPIFEDDCYADLIWSGERPPAIYAMSKTGGVVHIGSFSKSVAPALRVGYILANWEVLSRVLSLKTDAGSGSLEQMVLGRIQ